MRNPLRLKNLRWRFLPALLGALVCLVWLDARPGVVALGVAAVGLGLGLRAWGAGHLVKREELAFGGPYAHMRHPLYAGTLLIVGGFAFAAGPVGWLLLLPALLWFFVGYLPAKERRESALLEQLHGGAYTAYRSRLRPLLPSRGAWRPKDVEPSTPRWSAARYVENNELGTALGVAVGLALLGLRAASP